MTKILPVDGAKRDIWSTAGDEHDELYRKLLIEVLYNQEENCSDNAYCVFPITLYHGGGTG